MKNDLAAIRKLVGDITKEQLRHVDCFVARSFGGKVDDPRFILLRMSHGKAHFWTIEKNMRENEIPVIEF